MFHSHRKSLLYLKAIVTTIAPISTLCILQNIPLAYAVNYSTDTSKKQSFTVNYFVNSCGFSPETALKASKRALFETSEKPDAVLTLFRNLDFSDSQLNRIIGKAPELLLWDPVKILLPKLEFFKSKGASSSDLVQILNGGSRLLCRSLKNHIIPNYDFVKGFLHSDKRTITSIKRCPSAIVSNRVKLNVKFLLDYGVPHSSIAWLLYTKPRLLNYDEDGFKAEVEKVKELGFDPSKYAFIPGLCARKSSSKAIWERKVKEYKRWGLSDEAIHQAFVKQPWCMIISERKIAAAMEFFVNQLGWDSSVISRNPVLLLLSLEKRIIPRTAVLQFLQSKGLIKRADIVGPYFMPEERFMQNFVNCFKDQNPQLLKLYREKLNLST